MAGNTQPQPQTPQEVALGVVVAREAKEDAPVTKKSEPREHVQENNVMELKKPFLLRYVILSLTLLTFLLSFPVLFSIVWLIYMGHYDCEETLSLPKLQMGIVTGLICVFFISNLVVYLRTRIPIPGLIVVMVPLTVMFTVGLAQIGAFRMDSRTIPGSPMWLKRKVHGNNWDNIKSCIYASQICGEFILRSYNVKPRDFTRSKLSPIESGCCKPPASCGMEYVNATFWSKGNAAVDKSKPYNIDCDQWENDETTLCFNCHSCKESFLETIQGKWTRLGVFFVTMSILLMVSHLLLFVVTMWEHSGG